MTAMTMRGASQVEDSARRFVMTLEKHAEGHVTVRSCEILGTHFRNRTSFPVRVEMADVLQGAAATAVGGCLAKLSGENEVLSLPSFLYESSDLVLSGAHIIATRTGKNTMNIIVRFGFFLGGINRIFKDDMGFDNPMNDHSSHLSAAILSDLALPLLHICRAAEQGLGALDGQLGRLGATLAQRSGEIAFQVELLNRYLASNLHEDARSKEQTRFSLDEPLDLNSPALPKH